MQTHKILRPDSKGRIVLGSLACNISSYHASIDEITKEIHLTPYMEIPFSEHWLFNNPEALESVQQGLKQSAANKVRSLGSFAKKKLIAF